MGRQWNCCFVFDFPLVCRLLLRCSLGIITCGRRQAWAEGEVELGIGPRSASANRMGNSGARMALWSCAKGLSLTSHISQFLHVETPGRGVALERALLWLRQSLEKLRADVCLPAVPQRLGPPALPFREVGLAFLYSQAFLFSPS